MAMTSRIPGESQRGFTTIEVIVALAITVMVMVFVLNAFDTYTAVSRTQLDLSDLQQSIRVAPRVLAQQIRMAGRGGLPRAAATSVLQDAPASTTVAGAAVVEETDVLTLRGAFTAPIYRVDAANDTTFVNNGDGTATLTIDSRTAAGFDQPLDSLHALETTAGAADPEPIVLVSRQSDAVYAVVELAGISFANTLLAGGDGERATLALNISAGTGSHTGEYLALSSGGAFPVGLTNVVFATVLEEYSYFIREARATPGDATSPLRPKLSRARMVPGTTTIHPSTAVVDIADGIVDLQIAFGIDLDADGTVDDLDGNGDPLAGDTDEWLWNHANDDTGLAWDTSTLQLVRFLLLGQTSRPDLNFISEPIDSIENRTYAEADQPLSGDMENRRYRRRLMRSVVDLRNL